MPRLILLIIVALISCSCSKKELVKSASLSLLEKHGLSETKRVIGYRFNTREYSFDPFGGQSLIVDDGQLDTKKLRELQNKQAVLSNSQVDRLLNAIYNDDNEVLMGADCHNPHHIFVFYDGNDQVINIIEVCFECLNTIVFPSLAESQRWKHDYIALSNICNELGIEILSKNANINIEYLKKENKSQ